MVGGWTKTKLMLNLTQVEVKVEVGFEFGNNRYNHMTLYATCDLDLGQFQSDSNIKESGSNGDLSHYFTIVMFRRVQGDHTTLDYHTGP